jgi:HK97 gp10 family phage protein
MNDIQFRLSGVDGLLARLKKFPDKLQQAAGRKSARKAMAIVRRAAQAASRAMDDPASAERIWKNIYLQQSRRQSKRVGGVVMRVGVSGGARRPVGPDPNASAQPGGDTRHWRYVELGTEKTPARPFLRPAFENNTQAVVSTLITELNREIDQISQER